MEIPKGGPDPAPEAKPNSPETEKDLPLTHEQFLDIARFLIVADWLPDEVKLGDRVSLEEWVAEHPDEGEKTRQWYDYYENIANKWAALQEEAFRYTASLRRRPRQSESSSSASSSSESPTEDAES